MCAVVRLRSLMARQAARLITNPPILSGICHLENIVVLGINIPPRVIDSEADSYFSVEPDCFRWIKLKLFFA
jgi:hypothetical protein